VHPVIYWLFNSQTLPEESRMHLKTFTEFRSPAEGFRHLPKPEGTHRFAGIGKKETAPRAVDPEGAAYGLPKYMSSGFSAGEGTASKAGTYSTV
jgi:hypothetical protein